MAQQLDRDMDVVKLTFLRELVQASHDPEAESFPLMELARSVVDSAMTSATLLRRVHVNLQQ